MSTQNRSFEDKILGVRPTSEGVTRVIKDTLEGLYAGDYISDNTLSFLIEEITRIFLNWMGRGDEETIKDYLEHLHDILGTDENVSSSKAKLSQRHILVTFLKSSAKFLHCYLLTDNAIKAYCRYNN